jgi:hypothetical protein
MKTQLNVELYSDITTEGVFSSIFIGDEGDAAAEATITWSKMIQNLFDAHQIVGRDKWLSKFDNLPYQVDSVAEIGYIISALRDTANLIEHELHQHKIFDRERWVAETDMDPARAHEYTEDLV